MKIIYKSKEVANTTKNYNNLINKPSINSIELTGNITTGDLNIYNKSDVEKLIASSRSVKQVSEIPTPTVKNTMYYVGPQADGTYHVYLYDSSNTQVDLGSSSLSMYKSGSGIEVDIDNKISFKKGKTLELDSEGKVTVVVDKDIDNTSDHDHLATAKSVYDFAMTGSTETSDGIRGLVPQPSAGDQDKLLKANGSWYNLYDMLYPIGSYALGVVPTFGTWVEVTGDCALWVNSSLGDGATISQALPKPSVTIANGGSHTHSNTSSNGNHNHGWTGWWNCLRGSDRNCLGQAESGTYYGQNAYTNSSGNHSHTTDTQGNHSHSVSVSTAGAYGDGTKVQPDAYVVKLWKRTA